MKAKPSIASMVLALPMLFFGCLMFLGGYVGLVDWRSESAMLIPVSLILLMSGSAVFVSMLWLLTSVGRNRLALRMGGIALAVSGTVLAMAAGTGLLPCSGPA